MTRKKKIANRKAALLLGAVSGASLLMPIASKDAQAQAYSCESGGALQTSLDISGCAVINYGLTPPEEVGLDVPGDLPPSGDVNAGAGGTYSI